MFEFDEGFVNLTRCIQTGPSALFVVSGDQSQILPVRSGIRQGFPLVLLLILSVVGALGLALQKDPGLRGIDVPELQRQMHIYSAFVGDPTLFLAHAGRFRMLYAFSTVVVHWRDYMTN